jgi:hypothetical protein
MYVDVAPADFPPKLAVTATIDTDGRFFLSFTEARSIGSYQNWRYEEETIIRKGVVSLYDETDGSIVCTIDSSANSGFDMSLHSGRSGYATVVNGLQFAAGHAYRLTLDIDGYPVATATAVMPAPPLIEKAEADMQQTLYRSSAYRIDPSDPHTVSVSSISCHPLTLHLTDNSPERDYYMISLQNEYRYPDGTTRASQPYIAISDRAVIQDNPDIEAAQLYMDSEADAFIFDRMLLSDMSFANAAGILQLLIASDEFEERDGKYPAPSCPEDERIRVTTDICVAHLSNESHAYYRSLSLQKAGMGFFTEPVPIISNVENGYGCFSAIHSVRKTIVRYEICFDAIYGSR